MALPGFSLGDRFRKGETVYTAWCNMASPLVTEVMAREGFSAVTVDEQHGLWDRAGTLAAIGTIRQGGAAPIVRVPLNDFGGVSRVLDWGAEGVIMPMINNVADAKRFVGAAKLPPIGERSWGPHRAMMHGGITDQKAYLTGANDAIVTMAMVETVEAMDNLDAIAAVEGIDMIFVGPSDLSINLSKGGSLDPHGAPVEAALDKILAACKKAGKIPGLYARDAERAVATAKRGFRFLAVGSDLGFLRNGVAPQLKTIKG